VAGRRLGSKYFHRVLGEYRESAFDVFPKSFRISTCLVAFLPRLKSLMGIWGTKILPTRLLTVHMKPNHSMEKRRMGSYGPVTIDHSINCFIEYTYIEKCPDLHQQGKDYKQATEGWQVRMVAVVLQYTNFPN
jgi:hypothetical protein